MSDDHELMTSILDWFGNEAEEWIPGIHGWVGELIVGPIPLASANSAYDLADQWGDLAQALNDAYSDVMRMANPILESWSGDGAAQVFVEQWFAYLEGLRQTAESAGQMQRGVQNFGLEVELMKFMAALNLIMLAVSIFMLIAAIIPTGGSSLTAAPGLFAATRLALTQAAEKTVGKIASIAMRIVMRSLTRLFGRLPGAVAGRVIEAAGRVAATRFGQFVTGRVLTAATRAMTENLLAKAARRVAARGISKAVANRMAAQALRGLAAGEIRGALRNQATRVVQRELAREIRQQLLKEWTGKASRELGRKLLLKATGREARDIGRRELAEIAAREVAGSTLGREFASYVGTRVAFGAGFMGGGNLLGQFGQIVSGNRTEGVDWAQVRDGAVQGAAFGAGMFGGPLGHMIGGAAAGGGLTLGQEVWDRIEDPKNKIDWNAVGHSAVQGGAAGAIFGTQTVLEQAKFSLPHTRIGGLRIGADVHVLPGHDGGFNVLATRANNHEGLLLTSDGYVAWQGRDGMAHLPEGLADRPDIAQVRDEHFSKLDVDPKVQGGPATPAGGVRTDSPTGTRAESGSGTSVRSGDGGGGGGGGGGPRQNASGGGTTTRTGEPVRSSEPTPRTIERVRVPGGDGAPTVDRTGPVDRGGTPEATGDRAPADRTAPTGRDDGSPDGGGDPRGTTTRGDTDASLSSRTSADTLTTDRPAGDALPSQRTADPVPTDHAPSDRAPADGVPTDRPPTDGPPPDRSPADRAPADRVPADRVPADRVSGERTPGGEARSAADGPRPGGDRTVAGGDRVGPRDGVAPGGERTPAGGGRVGAERAPVGGERVPTGSEAPRGGERPVRDGVEPAAAHARDGHPVDGTARTQGEGRSPRGADPTRDPGTSATDRGPARPEQHAGTRDTVPAAREGGDGGPPPDGPPHDPTTARPEQHHPVDEPVMRSAGAGVGEPPTPESIRQGTVRMELHPEFPEVVRFLDEHGFRLVEDPTGPNVVLRHVYSLDGKVLLREEREIRYRDDMRFLDLEHEIDHVRQLMDRFHGDLGTEAVRERANGTQVEMKNAQRILSKKYDTIAEYHVRLQETIRLIERGVDPSVIREHLGGTDYRKARMNAKVNRDDVTAQAWRREHFGDIPSLERRLGELRTEFESGASRSEGPAGRPDTTGDGPRMAKQATPGHADDHLPARDEPTRDEPVRDEPVRDEPVRDEPVRDEPARDEPATQRDADAADPAPDASTGAAIRPRDEVRAFDWADRAYDRFRADDADVAEIAANLADTPRPDGGAPFTPAEIHQIKQHLMVEDHPIRDYDGTIEMRRFDASPDIAEAWIRLREGHPLPEDLVLLGHELAESNYMRQHPEADYRTAHEAANEQHNWQDIVPERTGEDLDIKWGRHSDDGNSGRLPEDPGNRDTGGVPLRTSGDGPPPGDREIHSGGHSRGRDDGPHVRGGVHEDPAAAAGTGELAGGRDVRGVDPARLVPVDGPVPERPVAASRDVAAVLDREVTELVRGRDAGPADQPHRVDWDPQTRTLRVRYGDGLEVDVVVQVNESVPPGRSVVVRPPMEAVEGGGWRQTEPAGVVLSSHLPADPVARAPHVEESLREAWRTLHDEVGEQLRLPDPSDGASPPHDAGPPGDGPPPAVQRPAPDALRVLEDPVSPEPPVRDADVVGRHPVTPADPPPPAPLTPDGVRQAVTGRGGPEQLGRWAGEHLVDRAENGRVQPKPAEEIAAVMDRFADEAADLVGPATERAPVDEVRHNASPIADTDFVPNGRPWNQPDVSLGELHQAAHGTLPTDFADAGVVAVHSEGPYVKVTLADGGERHFVPQVAGGMRDLAETIVRAGTADDPHLVYVNHRVAADQLPRVWVHEITETLAMQHAAQTRPEPHGLLRRAMTALGRIFGGGEAARPEATPRVEPHVAARLNERVHLQRLHDWAGGRPEEQARLRREISGVDRDLAALGHRVDPPEVYRRVQDWGQPDTSHLTGVIGGRHGVPPNHGPVRHGGFPHDAVPQQRQPHDLAPPGRPPHDSPPPWAVSHDLAPSHTAPHDPAPSHVAPHDAAPHDPGPHHAVPHDLNPQHAAPHDATPIETSHDRHWTDKPWEREGRRPSFDELIPVTNAEAAKWAGEVKAEFARQIEGREFGDGFRVRFDEDGGHPITVDRNHVVLRFKVYDADGSYAGRTIRVFSRESDGTLYVTHSSINLTSIAQGRSFSEGWNGFLEGWYHESGVNRIEVHAVNRGAYAWAKADFEWEENTKHRADQVLGKLRVATRQIDEHLDQVARWQRGETELDLASLLKRYGVDHPHELPERMRHEREEGQEILDRAARNAFDSDEYPTPYEISQAGAAGRSGRDQLWVGKEALLGSDWRGVKPISDGGVVNPHPRVESPPEGRPITAAAVPHGEFHGAARELPEPEVVRDLAQAALGDAPPVRVARVDLDVVPADSLPDGAVARSVPVDGAGRDLPDGHLPPPDGGYRIEVSDRAGDLAVPRAIRHEVAELNAIGERARAGLDLDVPDVLRPGDVSDGPLPTRGDLSPHDLGRLAERDYLHELARNPEHVAHARAELDALDRHLGLHPDDPGADARLRLVDERGERPGATWPARTSRVPFEFERFLHDPRWGDDATLFEQRLGAHYFRDPEVLATARTALTRLRDVLVDLTELRPGETHAELVARVESAFFREDEPTSAGQVGHGVGFDRLVAEGNLRETMTAFYNAAYCNWPNPHTLSHALLKVLDGNRWEHARAAGIDVAAARQVGDILDGNLNRLLPESVQKKLRFGRDFFDTGNVVRNSDHGWRDLAETTLSQGAREPRSQAEQLTRATTSEHYARLGTPLGQLERAYVDRVNLDSTGRPLGENDKLPWREGITAHDTDHGPWAWWVGRDGFPVIDGVSGTTARMLTAARFIGLEGPHLDRFLSGLMGWMLPARDHSLFEILRGSEIAGLQRVDVRPGTPFTAIDLYRSLPDVDLATLRAEVGVDGLFPHEARYLDHALDPHGFSETQHKVPQIADRLWPQLESGHVRDADLADWLHRNGVDPDDPAAVRDLAQRISKPHVMALTVYTRHSHYLINNIIRGHLWTHAVGETPTRVLFDHKVRDLVSDYLDNLAAGTKALPLPLKLRPVVHVGEGHLSSRSELAGPAQRYVDAHRRIADAKQRINEQHEAGNRREERLARADKQQAKRDAAAAWKEIRQEFDRVSPQLADEMRWHADMVHDAMMQLPAVGSPDRPVIAYRGDWITPGHSPIYGSSWHPVGTAREFLSVSRRLDVAVRFMSENPASGGKVLVVYRLTGQHARDISVFSSFASDDEAVFPPRSRMRRTFDPELVEQVRAGLPDEFRDNCEIIVMEED